MSRDLDLYLGLLFGAEPPSAFIEVRFRLRGGGMGAEFHPVCERDRIRDRILGLGKRTDCYVGVAPRIRRSGTRADVTRAHVLWCDLDDTDAAARVDAFSVRPSMVVSSGRGLHAYWALWPPLDAQHLRRANRRLAYTLRGDQVATDAARILRPPGTLNLKHGQPRPVETVHVDCDAIYTAREVVTDLPDPPGGSGRLPRLARPLEPSGAPNVMEGLTRTVREAQIGNRNATLYWAARRACEHVELHELDGETARQALRDAGLSAGLDETEIAATIRSGFEGPASLRNAA